MEASLEDCAAMTEDLQAVVGGTVTVTKPGGGEQPSVEFDDERMPWRPVFQWLMNVVLYATNCGDRQEVYRNPEAAAARDLMLSMPENSAKEKVRQRLKTMDKGRRIVLGSGVQLEVLDGGQGLPLTIRVRVQGHWRRQPHGEGRKQRKLIWIEPFWRGPEDGVVPAAPVHRLQ